jgi:hypothetical protein
MRQFRTYKQNGVFAVRNHDIQYLAANPEQVIAGLEETTDLVFHSQASTKSSNPRVNFVWRLVPNLLLLA